MAFDYSSQEFNDWLSRNHYQDWLAFHDEDAGPDQQSAIYQKYLTEFQTAVPASTAPPAPETWWNSQDDGARSVTYNGQQYYPISPTTEGMVAAFAQSPELAKYQQYAIQTPDGWVLPMDIAQGPLTQDVLANVNKTGVMDKWAPLLILGMGGLAGAGLLGGVEAGMDAGLTGTLADFPAGAETAGGLTSATGSFTAPVSGAVDMTGFSTPLAETFGSTAPLDTSTFSTAGTFGTPLADAAGLTTSGIIGAEGMLQTGVDAFGNPVYTGSAAAPTGFPMPTPPIPGSPEAPVMPPSDMSTFPSGAPLPPMMPSSTSSGFNPASLSSIAPALNSLFNGSGGTGTGTTPGGSFNPLSLLGIGSGLNTMFNRKDAVDPAMVAALWRAGQNTYNTSLDPQEELRKRNQQRVVEGTRAGQSARGIAMSPYAAGGESDAIKNFNLDWENQRLARQVQGTGAFAGAGNVGANAGIANNAQAFLQNQTGLNNLTTGLSGLFGGNGAGFGSFLTWLQNALGGGSSAGSQAWFDPSQPAMGDFDPNLGISGP